MKQNEMADLMKKMNRMRKDMDKANDELKDRYVEASSPDDVVEVTFNGQQELKRISFDEPAVPKNDDGSIDFEMLEAMIISAVNRGIDKAKELANEATNDATGGLAGSFPGLF